MRHEYESSFIHSNASMNDLSDTDMDDSGFEMDEFCRYSSQIWMSLKMMLTTRLHLITPLFLGLYSRTSMA